MKSKLLLILLIFTLVFSFSILPGCKDQTAETTAAETTAAETTAAEISEPVNIKFMHIDIAFNPSTFEKLVSMFEEQNPNITVDMETVSTNQDEYYMVLNPRLAGNKVDVYGAHIGTYLNMYDKDGYVYDLSNEPFAATFKELVLKYSYSEDGRLLGAAPGICIYCYIYNKDMFEQYNVKPPSLTANGYEEFLQICDVFKENGIIPLALGAADPVADAMFDQLLGSLSPEPDKNPYKLLEEGKITFADEPFKTVFLTLKEMADRGIFQENVTGTTSDAAMALFAQEKAAMLSFGSWAFGAITEQNPEIKQGVIIAPTPGVEPVYEFLPAMPFVVNAKSDKIAASLKFVEFLTSMEAEKIYSDDTLNIPAIKGLESSHPEILEAENVLKNMKGIATINFAQQNLETYPTIIEIANSIIGGTATVDEAIAKGQARLEEVLKK